MVITDFASNLARLRKVITIVDQPAPSELATIKLRHAAAVDVPALPLPGHWHMLSS